ncbi:uncharacterized protein AMSG_02493 [Thecamonas trahens ATCC 50062]|uniref:Uncharacterized protein n=1 Tax=Thecamonas trahens ATCC 50062 TaxID=461836 RepID=A0A0L0D5W4_THETB|nr:hypothetical protein AMSG_02493 [Thecamonas trahens ATCC 50062]KNC47476.1 hypothetical protein AMSG_02493 [Thecamonas trahens ATCC 50062]|eukprot:XP_013759412.1 hypothetical protein AMSG_02493 [Thecamonas trahens ATCC 50062]
MLRAMVPFLPFVALAGGRLSTGLGSATHEPAYASPAKKNASVASEPATQADPIPATPIPEPSTATTPAPAPTPTPEPEPTRGALVTLDFALVETPMESGESAAVERTWLRVFLGDKVLRVVEQIEDAENKLLMVSNDIVYDFADTNVFVSVWDTPKHLPPGVWTAEALATPSATMEMSLHALNALRDLEFRLGVTQSKMWAGRSHLLPSRFDMEVAYGIEAQDELADGEVMPVLRAAPLALPLHSQVHGIEYLTGYVGNDGAAPEDWQRLAAAQFLPLDDASAVLDILTPPQRGALFKFLLYHTRLHPKVFLHLESIQETLPYSLEYHYRRGGAPVVAKLQCVGVRLGGEPALVAKPRSAFAPLADSADDDDSVLATRVLARDGELDALLHNLLANRTGLLALSAPDSVLAAASSRAAAAVAEPADNADGSEFVQAYLEYLGAMLGLGADVSASMHALAASARSAGSEPFAQLERTFGRRISADERSLEADAKVAIFETDIVTGAAQLKASPALQSDSLAITALAGLDGSSAGMVDVMTGMAALQWSAYDLAIEYMKAGLAQHPLLGAVYKDLGVTYWYRQHFWDAWACFAALRRLTPSHNPS